MNTRLRASYASLPCLFILFGLESAVTARAELVYGFTTSNQLFFVESTSGARTNVGTFSGSLWPNEKIAGIEYRPSNRTVYALGYEPAGAGAGSGQLYTVDLATAALTPVGTRITMITSDNDFSSADSISIEIDPYEDLLRYVSAFKFFDPQSYRIDPDTGVIQSTVKGTKIDFSISAIAYDNHAPAGSAATLYSYVGALLGIVEVTPTGAPLPPDSWTVQPRAFTAYNGEVISSTLNLGFDISGKTGIAYFAIENDFTLDSGIYTADLSSLAGLPNVDFNVGVTPENTLVLTRIADFGADTIVDITVVPEASSFVLAAVGFAGLLLVRRKR